MPEDVVIYTKPGCPYCAAAKEDMADKGMRYEERDVTSDPAVKEEAIRLAGQAAVPVIVQDGEVTVGFGGS
ncbi:MAG: glutaredoxin family protein [Actinobacteria bacterium]|nr:glutaredoxin family protein [Actinomycetota bacterium]